MRTKSVGLTMWLCCALSASVCQADLLFHVSLNTAPLVGLPSPPSPFSIEFELTDGGGAVTNTAFISNFTFGGGAPSGLLNFNPATAGSGDLSSSVTLHDGTGFLANTFTQEFTPGSALDFDVQLTTNVDSPPDVFSFAILDSSGNRIPTEDTFGTDFFFTVELNSLSPPVDTFRTDLNRTSLNISAPVVQVIPEPTTLALLVIGLAVILVKRRMSHG